MGRWLLIPYVVLGFVLLFQALVSWRTARLASAEGLNDPNVAQDELMIWKVRIGSPHRAFYTFNEGNF